MERVLYRTAAMTGMRRGELLALRWMDVAWTNRVIRVRRSFTRGEFGAPKSRRSSRAVPLADSLAAELERYHQGSHQTEDDDLVFRHPLTGRPYDPAKLRRRFQASVSRAGLRPIRFHDLRHTFGTRMASAGAPLRAVQEWMGHRDFRTTLIYADYAPDASAGAQWAERAFGGDGGAIAGRQAAEAPSPSGPIVKMDA
jgi:integrase